MMPLGSALIALTLLLGANAPSPAEGPILTQVGMVDINGVEWRGEFHGRLSQVAQKQGTTVWTADRATAAALAKRAGNVLMTPRVVSDAGAEAVVNSHTGHPYVARLGRVADGAVNRATAVAFEPHVDAINEGCEVRITGRALDQGVLARVSLSDTRFDGLHIVTYRETVQPKEEGGKPRTLAGQYQVPEVSTAEVAGEWLIPKDGVLIVSTGVHSRRDENGKLVTTERLFLIEAKPAPLPEGGPQPAPAARGDGRARFDLPTGSLVMATPDRRYFVVPASVLEQCSVPISVPAPPRPAPIAVAGIYNSEPVALAPSSIPTHETPWRVMPALPSRTLPRGVKPDGTAAPLPPLPDETEAASFEEESAEPRPSPQAPRRKDAKKPEPPADLTRGARWNSNLLMALPIGPLVAELRYVEGAPHRLAVGLRLGSIDVGQVLDEAVMRTSAEAPAPASVQPRDEKPAEAPAAGKPPRSVQIKVSAEAKPVARADRPVRIELPIGPGAVRIEIRATRTPAQP